MEPAQSKVQWRQWVRVRVLGWNQHTAKYSGDNGLGLERVEPAYRHSRSDAVAVSKDHLPAQSNVIELQT